MSDHKIGVAILGSDCHSNMRLAQLILGIDGETDTEEEKMVKAENGRLKIVDESNCDVSLHVMNKDDSRKIENLNITSPLVVVSLDDLCKLIRMGEPPADTTSLTALDTGRPNNQAGSVGGHHNAINIILLGQAGTGKSACGNTILGKKGKFSSKVSSRPVTRKCQNAITTIDGRQVNVIDTPDYLHEDMQAQLDNVKSFNAKLIKPGTCVYLLVMQLGRFTDGERTILSNMEKAFGEHIREKTIILFTHGESLKQEDTSLKAFVNRTEPLKILVDQCGGRCHVFDNNNTGQQQVNDLMQMVYDLTGLRPPMEGYPPAKKPSAQPNCVVC